MLKASDVDGARVLLEPWEGIRTEKFFLELRFSRKGRRKVVMRPQLINKRNRSSSSRKSYRSARGISRILILAHLKNTFLAISLWMRKIPRMGRKRKTSKNSLRKFFHFHHRSINENPNENVGEFSQPNPLVLLLETHFESWSRKWKLHFSLFDLVVYSDSGLLHAVRWMRDDGKDEMYRSDENCLKEKLDIFRP